jgi:methanogenic corrinoid protein MtbC1
VNTAVSKIKKINNPPKILVGGHAFDIDKTIWQKTDADFYAKDFKEAIEISEKISI